MLAKLTLRNVKRSFRDYMIYVLTMTLIGSLMFAFNGMMFSKAMKRLYTESGTYIALASIASIFIVWLVVWLIHYMVRFMLERRSREFATYLLLGIRRRRIAASFCAENLLLCLICLLLGVLPGSIFQIAFTDIFYSFMDAKFPLTPDFSPWNYLLTPGLFVLAYLLAWFRIGGRFKKMTIVGLIRMERANESNGRGRGTWKRVSAFIAIAYILFFDALLAGRNFTQDTVWYYGAGLVAAIYLLYFGLSYILNHYIEKRGRMVTKGANLFIWRQLSSRIRTMRVTFSAATVFFAAALLAFMCSVMFIDFQNHDLKARYPFDVLIYSENRQTDFAKEHAIMETTAGIRSYHTYRIYQNGSGQVRNTLLHTIDGAYEGNRTNGGGTYYPYDTYMKISDYNTLLKMAGRRGVRLQDGKYLIQCVGRVRAQMKHLARINRIGFGGAPLVLQQIKTGWFSQNGFNGADYLIVVPDNLASHMTPYYSVCAAQIRDRNQTAQMDDLLAGLPDNKHYKMPRGEGSDGVLPMSSGICEKYAEVADLSDSLLSMGFILAYVALTFLVAALTVLSVCQLSCAQKYRYQYKLLGRLGVNRTRLHGIIRGQLGLYYLCPFAISVSVSIFIGMYLNSRFVYLTGAHALHFSCYLGALLIFTAIYLLYVVVTYIAFTRRIDT